MVTEKTLERINELYHKSKAEGLTDAELAEQKQLRADYVKAFRENLRGQLESIKIKNPDGSFIDVKDEVRQLIMNRRNELSDENVEMQSRLIIDRLKKSDIYKKSENVFLYMSYNREVDTYMLLSQCFMDGK